MAGGGGAGDGGACSVGAVITDARPVELSGDDLTVGFPMSAAFLKRQAEDPDNRAIVTEALRRLTGRRVRLSYELREELGEGGSEGSGGSDHPITEEELLNRLKAEFDAEEIPIASESAPVTAGEKGSEADAKAATDAEHAEDACAGGERCRRTWPRRRSS